MPLACPARRCHSSYRAEVETELDHHTEVSLDAGTLTVALWTHVRNAVTAADIELARRLDVLLAREADEDTAVCHPVLRLLASTSCAMVPAGTLRDS